MGNGKRTGGDARLTIAEITSFEQRSTPTIVSGERGVHSMSPHWLRAVGRQSVTCSLQAPMIRCSAGHRASGLVASAALVGRLPGG